MNPQTIDYLTKIAILAQNNLEPCKEHLIKNFNDLITADGGDDDFAECDSLIAAKALVAFIAPIDYCTMHGSPLYADRYLELYLKAKETMLGISPQDENIINYINH